MGVVYRAKHKLLDQTVAVKMLHKELVNDPVNLRRFQIEVRAASALTHVNLAAVYDSGVTDKGTPYLVMDYLEGVGLDAILAKDGFLEGDRFFDIFAQVCEALTHAHSKKIIHRDLKPSNIVVVRREGGQEHVKLVDFGIARVLQQSIKDGSRLTQTGEVIGSPTYMSPEQCLGYTPDERSDIYSLGVVMYEALTGVPPFQGDNSIQIIVAHINDKPRPISKLRPDLKISAELDDLIMKALEKEPDKRFCGVKELSKQLLKAKESPHNRWLSLNSNKIYRRLRHFSNKDKQRGFTAGLLVACLVGLVAFFLANKGPGPIQTDGLTIAPPKISILQRYLDEAQLAVDRDQSQVAFERYRSAIAEAKRTNQSPQEIFDICSKAANDLMVTLAINRHSIDGADGVRERNKDLVLAKPFYEEAIALAEGGAASPDTQSELLSYLAEIVHLNGDFASEEQLLKRCVQKADPNEEGASARCAGAYLRLAGLFQAQHRYKDEEWALKKALENSQGMEFPDAKIALANLYAEQGKPRAAESVYRKLIETVTKSDDKVSIARILPAWEKILRSLNKKEEAQKVAAQMQLLGYSQPSLGESKRQASEESDWGHFFLDDQNSVQK